MTCEECGNNYELGRKDERVVKEKEIRSKQYLALLSVENVCFNDKGFYQSLAVYEACCDLLNEDSNDKTLDEIGELR